MRIGVAGVSQAALCGPGMDRFGLRIVLGECRWFRSGDGLNLDLPSSERGYRQVWEVQVRRSSKDPHLLQVAQYCSAWTSEDPRLASFR